MRTSDKEIQKRLDATIEYLAENGETHIEDLANYLSVSPLTVRRNIKELQEQNIIELKNSSLSLNQSAQKKWMRLDALPRAGRPSFLRRRFHWRSGKSRFQGR